jgi:cyclopropane-fatty-acyl-phospholipid synthase
MEVIQMQIISGSTQKASSSKSWAASPRLLTATLARKHGGAQKLVENILGQADVRIDGSRAWDIQVVHSDFFDRVAAGTALAIGESYMDGWWRCDALDQLFDRILRAGLDKKVRTKARGIRTALKTLLVNGQRRSKAYDIGKRHYDTGNRLFECMLDKRLNYSCAYWHRAKTLDDAQEEKLDLICRKLAIEPGMTVLDIGCGWGGFAKWAAEKYKAGVLGITVSREQAEYAKQSCQGLDVTIKLEDYRSLKGAFDRIVSIGMFEHVGFRNYREFFRVVRRCLKKEGLVLLHTIGRNTTDNTVDPWIVKYIFPNSMLPSARQIAAASEGLLVLEDWHSFGPHYDTTLMAWHHNFTRNWDKIKGMYDDRFYRMWTYYLLSCAGSFRSRRNQLWQIVFSRKGLKSGYPSKR